MITIGGCKMLREYLTNKWVLSAIGFLIALSVACVLWYRYDTDHDKQQLAKEEEMLRQKETSKYAETNSDTEQTDGETVRDMPTIENTSIQKNSEAGLNDINYRKSTVPLTESTQHTDAVRISRHGFGPLPEIPANFPHLDSWDEIAHEEDPEWELMARVMIKLWNSGIKATEYTMETDCYFQQLKTPFM